MILPPDKKGMQSQSLFTTQLLLNWIVRILFFTSLAALLPTFPTFLTQIGGNKSQIGIVMSSFAFGVLVFRPMVGKQLDSRGRKAVLIAGILIFIAAPILYSFIHSIPVLLPIRVFHGLGLAAFGTASITLITDAAPDEKRGEALSYTGIVNTIAFTMGPLVGSFVSEYFGYTTLFMFVAAMSGACLLVALFIRETKSDHKTEITQKYWQVIKHRKILVAGVIILMIGLTHGGVMFYLPIFLEENQIAVNIGLFFSVYGVAAFAIRLVIGRMTDKMGRGPFMLFAILSLMMGVFTLSHAAGLVALMFAATIYGLGFGASQPTLAALVADNTTKSTRGKIFSFYYGGFDLGIAVSGVVLGAIAEIYGIRTMFLGCVGLSTLALLVFTTQMETGVNQSLKSSLSFKKEKKKVSGPAPGPEPKPVPGP